MDEAVAQTNDTAVRLIAGGAATLAFAVLADSGLEHYRGSFHDPAMVLPLAASSLGIAFNGIRASLPERPPSEARTASHVAAVTTGLIGIGFHIYNITKQPGGVRMSNFFYAAPVGAPAALTLAGVLGRAADNLARGEELLGPIRLGSGRAVGGIAGIGILGTVGEAALLHFRGAFHDPFMWAPIVLPPVAAISLLRDVAADEPRRATFLLLGATATLGLLGMGFHAYGVSRNMGGWSNWRQNILAGPPIPAPPAFTGLAITGIGALLLMRRRARG